jgi:hemerythrin-like domain-containing protein
VTGIDQLFDEHSLILQVVEALAQFVDELERKGLDGRSELVRLMTFLREFADLMHHEKEESVLLPALVHAGLRWDDGVIGEIRKEHELEREMLQTLRHASLQSSPWSLMDRQRVVAVGRRFVQFMREHIAKEDTELRPLLSSRLDEYALGQLNAQLERFDSRMRDTGELRMLRDLGSHLCRS